MVREVLTLETRELKLGVTSSHIASARSRVERETAVRVYSDGSVGTASAAGDVPLAALTDQAQSALSLGIPYAATPAGARALRAEHTGPAIALDELVTFTEHILSELRADFPELIFSHGADHSHRVLSIQNDQGLDLRYSSTLTSMVFIIKERGSANIIDSFTGVMGPSLDREGTLKGLRSVLDKHSKPATPPSGRTRVIFAGVGGMAGSTLTQLFHRGCTARPYATGSSLFSGKIGDTSRPFHEDFHLVDARDAALRRVCPFDMEGTVRESLDLDIVRDGALRNVAVDKRDALRFGLTANGSAEGSMEALPTSALSRLAITPSAPTLAHLLDGEPGVLIWFSAGGDVTPTGDVAMPVQVAFQLAPDGSILGRTPGFTLTGNIHDLFGADYVGVSQETVDPFSDENWLVTHMTAHS